MSFTVNFRSMEELLATVMGLDIKMAGDLLNEAGTIYNIPKRDDLIRKYGIQGSEVGRLIAAIALADKARLASDLRKTMDGPEMIVARSAELRTAPNEEMWVYYLSPEQKILTVEKLAQGSADSATVAVGILLRKAILSGAAQVVMIHNHPDGQPTPSPEDLELTRIVMEALEHVRVRLVDHIIIGNGSHYSMANSGDLKRLKRDWQSNLPASSSLMP